MHVVSVNASPIRTVEARGTHVRTGIFKQPLRGRVAVRGVNLDGDDQADRDAHGGPTRALYAYDADDYRWWEGELGRTLPPGKFGENLTLAGVDVTGALIGERWRVGTTVVQVTSMRVPCSKLALTMDDPAFIKRFAQALRPGAYLAIVEEGEIGAGDAVEVLARPDHTLTLREMTRIFLFERDRAGEMLVPELPPSWREWAEARLADASTDD